MKRETRANLIFLGVFLAISTPGAVILFKKKLDPRVPKMFMPDAVNRRVPYMAPVPAPPDTKWTEPPITKAWVETLARERGGGVSVVREEPIGLPLMSEDHRVQVVTAVNEGGGLMVGLLVWDGAAALHWYEIRAAAASAGGPGGAVAGQVVSANELSVPEEVRRELGNAGLIRTPSKLGWISIAFPGVTLDGKSNVRLSMQLRGIPDKTFVNLFTRSDSTTK